MTKHDINIIVGTSHAGKSQFVKNTFIRGREFVQKVDEDIRMPYTELPDCILVGKYASDNTRDWGRLVGTDRIERKMVGNLARFALKHSNQKIVAMEGQRCVSRPMMRTLIDAHADIGVVYIKVLPKISLLRANEFHEYMTERQSAIQKYNLTCTENGFCKGYNMHENFIRDLTTLSEFKGKFDLTIVDSTNVADFTKFSMDDLQGATIVQEWSRKD